jgi:hypothetical protein
MSDPAGFFTFSAERLSPRLQRSLAGDYRFDVVSLLKDAWARTEGFKLTAWIAVGISIGASLVVSFLQYLLGNGMIATLVGLAALLVTVPIGAGALMLGVRHCAGEAVQPADVLNYFDRAVKLVGLYLLMGILIAIGMLLLILPGIYLAVAYSLAIPLILRHDLGIWEALELSRRTITKQWLNFFLLFLVLMVITFVSIIPFGIGLIWTLPLGLCTLGLLYHATFEAD